MTSKLFVAFVFFLIYLFEQNVIHYILRIKRYKLNKTKNRTGGNTNRCNFQTPFSLWLCFLLFQKTDNKLIEMPCLRFVSVCSFVVHERFQLKILQVLKRACTFFFQLESSRQAADENNRVKLGKKGKTSSLKLVPFISSQNIHRVEINKNIILPPAYTEKKNHTRENRLQNSSKCVLVNFARVV